MQVSEQLTLPCGTTLSNRIAKAAMSENMASEDHFPGKEFVTAYKQWVAGETGLLITGNVMVDSNHRGEAFNVVIEQGLNNHNELKEWANTSKGSSSQIWVQLNHPGKQSPKFLTKTPVGPSSIPLRPPLDSMFNQCRELSHEEILEIIQRFAYAAKVCKECGFAGVQIHGAHGYLVSQFLSPLHNKRVDQWGGSIENRMRFGIEIYKAMREQVGDSYPISLKMNSADFSKGGFSPEEAVLVAKSFSEIGIDLIEISGGSYEKPAMTGAKIKESTKRREAYFLEYAKAIKEVCKCPIMVTGGFRTSDFIIEALANNELDIIGLARPLSLDPYLTNKILKGEKVESQVQMLSSGIRFIDKLFPLEILWYTMQIHRMGKGLSPNPKASVWSAIFRSIKDLGFQSFKKVRGI